MRPDRHPGFLTPTGRVELWSTAYAHYGEDPLPFYKEPAFSPHKDPELAKKYPYILTTGARILHRSMQSIVRFRCCASCIPIR